MHESWGWALNFVTGATLRWTRNDLPLSAMALTRLAQQRTAMRQESIRLQALAADKAKYTWGRCKEVDLTHGYLVTKKIKPYMALQDSYGNLVIPLTTQGEIVSLQFISAKGKKRFLAAGKKKGCYLLLASEPNNLKLVCEGYATGCSLFEQHTGAVYIAFDAGNLKAVALAVRNEFPDADIIVCGDNDPIGVGKANEAAWACKGRLSVPDQDGWDWNDYYRGTLMN